MTSVAIDVNMLNELFDNQKNLDDIFNDDFIFDSSSFIDEYAYETDIISDDVENHLNKDTSSNSEQKYFLQNYRRAISVYMPVVLEIVVISYCIAYFT